MQPRPIIYFQSLQLIRGIASILVMTLHTGFTTFGWIGVDFFFVLSGFIIFHVHHHWIGQPHFVYHYIIKRISRIYPVYWFIAGSYLFIHYSLGNIGDFYNSDFWGFIQSFTLLPSHPAIILTSWTLSYELLFYCLFGLLIISNRFFLLLLIWFLLCFIQLLSLQYDLKIYLNGFYFNPINLEFALGIILFYIIEKDKIRIAQWNTYVFIVIGILISLWSLQQTLVHRLIIAGIPCFFILLGIICLEKYHSFKVHTWLVAIGNASYFLYLSHTIIISTFEGLLSKLLIIEGLTKNVVLLSAMLLSVVVSLLAYNLVEKPLIYHFRKIFQI